MTFVSITALTVPEGTEAEVERRFSLRARGVDRAEGFEGFELLRPVSGPERRFLALTRWRSREDYTAWSRSRAQRPDTHADDRRRGMSADVLGFEVVTDALDSGSDG